MDQCQQNQGAGRFHIQLFLNQCIEWNKAVVIFTFIIFSDIINKKNWL